MDNSDVNDSKVASRLQVTVIFFKSGALFSLVNYALRWFLYFKRLKRSKIFNNLKSTRNSDFSG